MLHVGLDVHWRTTTACILDQMGRKIKTMEIRGHWEKLLARLAALEEPFQVVFEASCGGGYLFDALSKIASCVKVAHPGQLRLIFRSKRKNDRVDAEKLAKLLYLDEVPCAYVPDLEIREWREMIEFRQAMVAKIVRCKNALRALLRTQGIVAPKGLWSRGGLQWLAEVAMTPTRGLRRDVLLDGLALHTRQITHLTRALNAIADKHSGVMVARTIPGVGPRTAEAVVAYLADPRRFSKNRAVGAYFGLVPCQDASAGVNRLGRVTREGPTTARKLLVEASWQVIRRCPAVRARFDRICQGRKDRRKKALVAVARHLACCIHSMLSTGEAWRMAG